MSNGQLRFDDFVDDQNSRASCVATLRGLGIPESPENNTAVANVVGDTITRVLAATSLPQDEAIALKDVLLANLAPLLPKEHRDVRSMIDIITPGVKDESDVKNLLRNSFGIDLNNKSDLIYTIRVFGEAVDFFNEHVSEEKKDDVKPELTKLKSPSDICRIFLTAAGYGEKYNIKIACALLRIAVVIDHIERDPDISALPTVEKRMLEIIGKHFKSSKVNSRKETFFTTGRAGDIDIPVERVELRTKQRHRMIAKLLHKPGHSGKSVLDRIGMRITTCSAENTLRLIHALLFTPSSVLPGMKVLPGESKNLIFNESSVRCALMDPRIANGLIAAASEETTEAPDLVSSDGTGLNDNPFSSSKYKAINITVLLPFETDNGGRREFPLEIQFMDIRSRTTTEAEAPHSSYEKKQMKAVRSRILSRNLVTAYDKHKKAPELEG